MYLNATGYYVPEGRVDNNYFATLLNVDEEWLRARTGIETRARASETETLDYMSIMAVENGLQNLPYDYRDIDLIIFASYTHSDLVGTTGHIIQREFEMHKAKVFALSAGCSSAINAMEIIRSFLKSRTISKALLVCADRNSTYLNESDDQSGHLWGDAAVAFFFSDEKYASREAKLIDVTTQGLGQIGNGPQAVSLNPKNGGLVMPSGRDVFVQACIHLCDSTRNIMTHNGYTVEDLDFFIGHQANRRILTRVRKELNIEYEKVLTNLTHYGNTGCASAPLVFAEHYDKFQVGDLICMSVFGGGYSMGSSLFIVS